MVLGKTVLALLVWGLWAQLPMNEPATETEADCRADRGGSAEESDE